jgi:hypothetical protein
VLALSTGDGITYTIVGVVLFVAIVAVWRVVVHDRTITRVRFGIFYERERDEQLEPEQPEQEPQRKEAP